MKTSLGLEGYVPFCVNLEVGRVRSKTVDADVLNVLRDILKKVSKILAEDKSEDKSIDYEIVFNEITKVHGILAYDKSEEAAAGVIGVTMDLPMSLDEKEIFFNCMKEFVMEIVRRQQSK